MNVRETILTRTTVHEYAPEPIPDGCVERAVETALTAPNHRMTEPWRFVRPTREAREALVAISQRLKSEKLNGPLPEKVAAAVREKMMNPAELLVIVRVRDPDNEVAREDYAAVACAVQNAALSLWSEGVGSKWSTGAVTRDAQTYQRLSVDPEREEIVGFFWIGMPSSSPRKPRRKLEVEDVVRTVD